MNQVTHFGERLKFFRLNVLKMKRKEFCEKFRLPIISVQGWENNGVKISKRQIDKLKKILQDDHVDVDHNWLFNGEGEPWEVLKKNNQTDHSSPAEFLYTIESYFFEPLIKKNSTLTLQSILLKDINCPAFVAMKDSSSNMHFGIISITMDKGYLLECFQGSFYKIIVTESDTLFLIKHASLYH